MPTLIRLSPGNYARPEEIRAVRFIPQSDCTGHGDMIGLATLYVDLDGTSAYWSVKDNATGEAEADRIAAEVNAAKGDKTRAALVEAIAVFQAGIDTHAGDDRPEWERTIDTLKQILRRADQ